ncbi:glyoxylate/hydroxypyruvate reductase A [Paraburkholderia sp.]|uniref:2-hydroxyacid dehydrogenase n=1 Tax=Paraburkholderia sp. TaxID=1926495 RepID=UPI00238688DE|nr:glyoxylate/hydroxypyruvate reductase A [Paraburkholderia sp.]MDE1181548.1 glyoxylate/hydroxypyruvate reductase A [Paraburkholderia sp.]
MKILFYSPQDDAADYLRDLSNALPDAQFREWHPGDTAHADIAIVWQPVPDVFAGRDDLRAVFNLGAGVDAILALERAHPGTLPRHAQLVRLEDSGMGAQMIEYVTYAVLRYMRRFDRYDAQQTESRWQVVDAWPSATFTVGVLGMGVLGAQVAKALAQFGMPVRGFSRSAREIEGIETFHGEAQFNAFLDGVKVLVNLLPHTPDTRGVLNAQTFSALANGAYLINVARGAHLVEQDLLDALASGQLAAATLDVFHQEPLPATHPFWQHPHITVTPHSSARTLRAQAVQQIARKIDALSRGEPLSGVVDPTRGY